MKLIVFFIVSFIYHNISFSQTAIVKKADLYATTITKVKCGSFEKRFSGLYITKKIDYMIFKKRIDKLEIDTTIFDLDVRAVILVYDKKIELLKGTA